MRKWDRNRYWRRGARKASGWMKLLAALAFAAGLALGGSGCSLLAGLDLSQFCSKPAVTVESRLVAPAGCEGNVCREEGWEIEFAPLTESSDGVGFILRNTGSELIMVVWDECAYVGPDRQASRVMHTGVRFSEADASQVVSVIPPGARLREEATPTEKVRFVTGEYGGWRITPLFAYLEADKLDGKTVGLFLTIRVGERKVARQYNWEVKATARAPEVQAEPTSGGVRPSNLAPAESETP